MFALGSVTVLWISCHLFSALQPSGLDGIDKGEGLPEWVSGIVLEPYHCEANLFIFGGPVCILITHMSFIGYVPPPGKGFPGPHLSFWSSAIAGPFTDLYCQVFLHKPVQDGSAW